LRKAHEHLRESPRVAATGLENRAPRVKPLPAQPTDNPGGRVVELNRAPLTATEALAAERPALAARKVER